MRTHFVYILCSTFFILPNLSGCFDNIPASSHGCDNCLSCEECIPSEDGAYCQATSNVYTQCGLDNNIHSFDSCDFDEGIVLECLNGSSCANTGSQTSICECTSHWQGESCDECPGNWDETQDCAVCQTPWIDEDNDCGTCPSNWDSTADCNVCLGNWDINQDCEICLFHWIDEENDCGTCPENWDAAQECNQCLGNWDSQQDCLACETQWIDENNDCGTCPENWNPIPNCNVCLGNWDIQQDCLVCETHWIDENNDCETCPGNWDPIQDCNACLGNWDPAQNCEECIGANEPEIVVCGNGVIQGTEECDDCNDIDWDGCTACKITEFQVNSDGNNSQHASSVAMADDGKFVISWTGEALETDSDDLQNDIFARQFDTDGFPLEKESRINTYTEESEWSSSIGIQSDGQFTVAWARPQINHDNVIARRFSASGDPSSSEFQVNTYQSFDQNYPSIAMEPEGAFVVAWHSWEQDGYGGGIFGQLYDSTGLPIGEEFKISSPDIRWHKNPSAAISNDGNYIISWNCSGEDDDWLNEGVFARRYYSDGTPVGEKFQVNTYTSNSQEYPDVAVGNEGTFVVVWQSGHDGSETGVFAQLYDADGSPVQSEIQVNSFTTDSQFGPSVAMSVDGSFIVTWTSTDQDGEWGGIFAQRYNPDGSQSGSEFPVNIYTSDNQKSPSVAMTTDGRFIIAWTSGSQDGDLNGIFAQRYDTDGNPLGTLPWDHFQ